jgi:acetyl esterase/lipase
MNRNYIQLNLRQAAEPDTGETILNGENDVYPEPDFNDTGLKKVDIDTEAEQENLHDSSVSIQGRVVRYLIGHITNDMAIGKKIKSGELRKRMQEPAWKVPDCFNMTSIDMRKFSMKLLTSKVNPNTDRIILQLHGGGYIGAVRNAYYVFAGLYNEVSRKCSVLTPDYRVAPENPFPAALEDAVSTYEWLLNQGWRGEQIIIAGDSAGGGLSMALTMYLRDNNMPLPGGIVAMSPWTDVTASGESYETNYEKDPLFGNTRESMIYINDYPAEHDPKEPYISPLFGDFTGFPPMLIQAGSIEMLLSDSVSVAEKARKQGVKVRLSIYEGMFHVFQMAYLNIPESRKAWQEVGKFLELI